MNSVVKDFNRLPRFLSSVVVAWSIGLFATTGLAETNNVVGVYTTWPTTWISLNGLNDPNDEVATHVDFVGDTTNPCGYYASANGYVFFRQRMQVNTTNQATFGNAHFVVINLIGTNYNAGAGEDGYPDYAFGWDNFNNTDIANHGLEMQVRGTVKTLWKDSNLNDLDGNAGVKGTIDINGGGRTNDGYIRVISEQNTTNFSFTTFIDYAVKWSYLQTYTGLNTNQSWKVAFASLGTNNDHQDLSGGDIAGGANPTSPLTNGWLSIVSTVTGSEILPRGSYFAFE